MKTSCLCCVLQAKPNHVQLAQVILLLHNPSNIGRFDWCNTTTKKFISFPPVLCIVCVLFMINWGKIYETVNIHPRGFVLAKADHMGMQFMLTFAVRFHTGSPASWHAKASFNCDMQEVSSSKCYMNAIQMRTIHAWYTPPDNASHAVGSFCS